MPDDSLIYAYIICSMAFSITGWLIIIFGSPKVLMNSIKSGKYDVHVKEILKKYILPAGREFMKEELFNFGEHIKKSFWGKQGNVASQAKKAEKQYANAILAQQAPMLSQLVKELDIPFTDNPLVAQFIGPLLAKKEGDIVDYLVEKNILTMEEIPDTDGETKEMS